MTVPRECRFCGLLRLMKDTFPAGELLPGEGNRYRCSVGRMDFQTTDGTILPNSWSFSTIIEPGKAVAAVQKDCPHFQVHPDLANLYPVLAKKFGID